MQSNRFWIPVGIQFLSIAICVLSTTGCSNDCSGTLEEIHISSPGRNVLKVQIDGITSIPENAYVRYWPQGDSSHPSESLTSENKTSHRMMLTALAPSTIYEFQVVSGTGKCWNASKVYNFSTAEFPVWMKDIFSVMCPDPSVLPSAFRKGYTMMYSKEIPGIVYFLNASGKIVWYHQVNGTGFKMAHFTPAGTIISLLGNNAYPTSYGNEILELSLAGDTIFHLKKGEKGLDRIIHHEVMTDKDDHIVTITSEDSVFDLRSVGGGNADTVKGDGILVLDRHGEKIWKWTVFDVMSPLADNDILKQKGDWMHANSLCRDRDGNYLISFYNTGQIWNVDARTGKLLWKFGKGGDFSIDKNLVFDQAHALHIDSSNDLMFFDNGVGHKHSRSMMFHLDFQNKKADPLLNAFLPKDFYNERMGSTYLLDDSALLISSSKNNSVLLTDLSGRFLWALKTRFSPYRTEFIPAEKMKPYILN